MISVESIQTVLPLIGETVFLLQQVTEKRETSDSFKILTFFQIPGMGTLYQVLTVSNQYLMVSVLPFIYWYNGQRGGSGARWQKELFYFFIRCIESCFIYYKIFYLGNFK